jgi:hypothetical protein
MIQYIRFLDWNRCCPVSYFLLLAFHVIHQHTWDDNWACLYSILLIHVFIFLSGQSWDEMRRLTRAANALRAAHTVTSSKCRIAKELTYPRSNNWAPCLRSSVIMLVQDVTWGAMICRFLSVVPRTARFSHLSRITQRPSLNKNESDICDISISAV